MNSSDKHKLKLFVRFVQGDITGKEYTELLNTEEVQKIHAEQWKNAAGETNEQTKPDTDKIWQTIEQTIEQNQNEEHQSPENVKVKQLSVRKWLKIAAAIALPVLGLMLGYLIYSTYLKKQNRQMVTVPKGKKVNMTLPDGSNIWLNAGSTIEYPKEFSGKQRKVILSGEAFFQVKPNQNKPFVVQTRQITVTVLGTVFNVSAYPEDAEIKTTLIKGKVEVKSNTNEKTNITLTPEQQAVFSKKNKKIAVKHVDSHKFSAWKNGKLVFDSQTIDRIARILERWYNVKIIVAPELNGKCPLTITLKDETIEQALDLIRLTCPVTIKTAGNQITITPKN